MNFITILRLLVLLSFTSHITEGDEYWKFSEKCMGTDFHILIDHQDHQLAKIAAGKAFRECKRLNNIFSDYITDSEVAKLSRSSYSNKSVKVSNELFDILTYSKTLSKRTNGAFDPTLGQLSRLWRVSRFRHSLPPRKSLLTAMAKKGCQHLELTNRPKAVRITCPGLILDFGGIAKGYAADQMMLNLRKSGIGRCLIDAGGDITLGDAPRDKEGWRIEIGGNKHPDLPTLVLDNCSVATSGDTEQYVEINNTRYSHIIDPQSGYGLRNLSQVTIIAPTGLIADSIATAALVLGPDKTKEALIENNQTLAYFITRKEKQTNLTIIKR